MNKIPKIESELIESLQKINAAITIIDNARATNETITHEQAKFIDNLDLIHSKEVISLMLESKSRKRNKKLVDSGISAEKYEPFALIDDADMNNFCSYLAGLPPSKAFHFDFILRPSGIHSSAIQIHCDGTTARSFYLENLADVNIEERNKIINSIGAISHTYKAGRILSADYGCTIFSLQHLNSMNRFIKEGIIYLPEGDVDMSELDPVFLKHGQGLSLLKKYIAQHSDKPLYIGKKKNKTLSQHLEDFTLTTEIVDKQGIKHLKKRNYSILYKTKKYLESSLALLESLDNDEHKLEEILYNRSVKPILHSVYNEMGLNQIQKSQVEGLYNQDQIRLALLYGIPKSLLQNAECLKTREMSNFTAYYIDNIALNNPELALTIFEQMRNLKNIYQARAMLIDKISPENILSSTSLANAELAPDIYRFIQKWHSMAGEDGLKAAFSLIKSLESSNNGINPKVAESLSNYDQNDFLGYAIFYQSTDGVKAWLKAGANINSDKFSSIDLAVKTNNAEIISEVILAGANITPKARDYIKENFPLVKLIECFKKAIDEEKVEAIQNIVQIYHPIISQKIDGKDPLDYVVSKRKLELLKRLLPPKLDAEKESSSFNGTSIVPFKRKKAIYSI